MINDFSTKKKIYDYNLLYLDFLKELTNKITNRTAYCKTAYIESVEKKNIYLIENEYYFYLLSREILPIINVKFLENLVRDFDTKEFVHKKIPLDFDFGNIRYKDLYDLKNSNEKVKNQHISRFGILFQIAALFDSMNIYQKVKRYAASGTE